jgi:hypothetical protein
VTIYVKLEKLLKQANKPLTCTDLYDRAEIRELVKSADDVSDRLGYMWRRKLLSRVPAPRTGMKSARWAYSWRKEVDTPKKPVTVEDVKPQKLKGLEYRREPDGAITIISDKLEITIRKK